jgi:tetratricopeptide (TPR) repeat protein
MSDSLGEFFRRFDEALAKWEREQSAPSLVEVVREARHKQPSGYAIIQAAVDWKLAGFDQLPHQRPISEEDLRALFPSYLAELEPSRPATKQEFRQGLRWALTPLGRHGSPVERCADALIDDCHKRGFAGVHAGYWLVEEAERRGRRVPEVAWELFLGRVRPCEAVAVGVAAVRQGNLVAAEGAYRVAMDAEDPEAGPLAACRLGLLRLYQGDGGGAQKAFRLAVASGHPEAAPEAATWLGGLLARRGDADAGRVVLRQAVASGHYLYAPEAAMAIGLLLADQGGLQEAMAALEQQAAAGDEDLSPRAALMLGGLLGTQGDVAGARGLLEQAIASGHFDVAPRASLTLGSLLASQEDPNQVRFLSKRPPPPAGRSPPRRPCAWPPTTPSKATLLGPRPPTGRRSRRRIRTGRHGQPCCLAASMSAMVMSIRPGLATSRRSTPTIRASPSGPPPPLGNCWPAAAMTGTPRRPGSRPSSSHNWSLRRRLRWRRCVSAGATVIVRQRSTSG